jgi:hypothetical protein
MVGPGRTLALIRTTLDQVKQVAHTHNATVNDVLLAATAGGLRALLCSRGEPVQDTTVRIYVPVSLRRQARGPQQGNLIAQMAVPLPLEVSEPGRRLDQIAAETAKRKARTRTQLGTLFRGRIARLLLLKAVMRQRVNVTSASIPGPQEPLYLAGARLLEVFPVLPLIANEPWAWVRCRRREPSPSGWSPTGTGSPISRSSRRRRARNCAHLACRHIRRQAVLGRTR